MHLLVDGHNLIGQIAHLSLADHDDEAQLVMLLRRYATAKRSRQVLVIFDHGVYGHPDRLDGYGVTCRFARSPQDADTQLIRQIRSTTRPREWTLVSSDRQVVRVADERGMRAISSHAFARQLRETPAAAPKGEAVIPAKQPNIRLSEAEIQEWLRIFGAEGDG